MNKRDDGLINKFPKSKTVTMFKNFKEKLQEPDKSEGYSNFYKFDNLDLFRKGW
jgi:ribosomal protein S20